MYYRSRKRTVQGFYTGSRDNYLPVLSMEKNKLFESILTTLLR